ncbi:MAG: cytochrome c [Saprospiraceae bacterium]|nr:cytochrome c [Saprospiraceae bacterium]
MINVFQDPAYHKLDFHFFTLTTTIDWYKIELEGIDSYAGSITNKIDTFSFNYGWYSSSVCDEIDPVNHRLSKDTVNGLIAYIIIPLIEGHGKIGMSIEKFKDTKHKFVISGRNITRTKDILKIFKSIEFSESDTTMNPILTLQKFNMIPTGSGKHLFKKYCAICHLINDNFTGPNLKNIMSRRSMNWIQSYLTNRKSLNLKVDPTKKSMVRSVEFKNLSYEEIERIIEFIN